MAVIAPLLIVAGLAVIGYSFLMGDPFATSAFFGAEPPSNSTMKLTVPEMQRVKEVPVYNGGHRMGFPGTKSYLVFWDLNKLEKGDEIILTDANGTAYTYEVFKEQVVAPNDLHVIQPVPGRSVVTLQTCTLPDYSERLIVQAELTSVA